MDTKPSIDSNEKVQKTNIQTGRDLIKRGHHVEVVTNAVGSRDKNNHDIALDRIFIGSCTNARIEDLRAAASVLKGRKISKRIKEAIAVPGSGLVKKQAEDEGLADIFIESGFQWRDAGCSMCLGTVSYTHLTLPTSDLV